MGCLTSGQKAADDPGAPQKCFRGVEPDPEKISALVDMGLSEKIARQALEACNNDLDQAAHEATERTAAESTKRFQEARQMLGEVESDVVKLEASSASGACSPRHLARLVDSVTRASCTLDGISVAGDSELRTARREELARCDKLEGQIQALKSPAPKEEEQPAKASDAADVHKERDDAIAAEEGSPPTASAAPAPVVSQEVKNSSAIAAGLTEAASALSGSSPETAACLAEAAAALTGGEEASSVQAPSPTPAGPVEPVASVASAAAEGTVLTAPMQIAARAAPAQTSSPAPAAPVAPALAGTSSPAPASTVAPPAGTSGSSESPGLVPTDMRIAGAECMRLAGNTAFKAGDFEVAAARYREALTLDSEDTAILSNLAAAEIRLGQFAAAVEHAAAADRLSGGFSAKALFRKGQALEGLGQFNEACVALKASLSLEPNDPATKRCLEACQAASGSTASATPL
mmetsp:Transcript_140914/g.243496  ORF Transcript_140914/g.243496 Transcript_140914/m.243496 type:complete len:463 (-) Transcript_140914:26-1414(-)